jgi:hypothetical protein
MASNLDTMLAVLSASSSSGTVTVSSASSSVSTSSRGEAIDTQLIALEVSNALDIVKRAKDNVGKPVSIDEAKSAAEIVDALRDDEIRLRI